MYILYEKELYYLYIDFAATGRYIFLLLELYFSHYYTVMLFMQIKLIEWISGDNAQFGL